MTNQPDLRTWQPGPPSQDVWDTKMLNTEARETPDTVKSENTNKEDTNRTPSFGKLGAQK